MGKGVAFPIRVDRRGGIPMTTDNFRGLLMSKLLPDNSTNPYNRVLGIGSPDPTYAEVNLATKADLRQRVTQVMREFEIQGRARLLSGILRDIQHALRLAPLGDLCP